MGLTSELHRLDGIMVTDVIAAANASAAAEDTAPNRQILELFSLEFLALASMVTVGVTFGFVALFVFICTKFRRSSVSGYLALVSTADILVSDDDSGSKTRTDDQNSKGFDLPIEK